MWYRCRSRSSLRVKVITFTFISLIAFIPVANAFLPAILAESAIAAVIGRIIVSRAAKTAANEAVYSTLVSNTVKALSKKALDKAVSIGNSSIYKNSRGWVTWAGVAYVAGKPIVNSLLPDDVAMGTSGTLRPDGKYDVPVNGKTYISDFEPSEDNPFFVKVTAEQTGYAVESDSADKEYAVYARLLQVGQPYAYFNSFDVSAAASAYANAYKNRNMIPCPSGTCTFQGPTVGDISKGSDRYTVKTSFQRTSSVSGREDKTDTYNLNVIVFINPDYKGATPITENGVQTDPGESSSDPDWSKVLAGLDAIPLKVDELANTINDMFLGAAAQPDYDGVPVTSSNPITADEVKAAYPEIENAKQSEWLKPAQVSATAPLNVAIPSPAAVGSTDNPAQVDLGADPGIEQPTLEDIPTGRDILAPILGMFDGFNTDITLKSVSCPTFSADIFGKHYVLDSQCEIMENNRSVISAIFLVIWGFMAFAIVIKA